MRLNRHPMALLVAGCWWLSTAIWAQEPALPTGGASSSGSSGGADSSSSTSGTPGTGASSFGSPFGAPGTPSQDTGNSPFGTPTTPGSTAPGSTGPGAASSFGTPTQTPTDAFGFPLPPAGQSLPAGQNPPGENTFNPGAKPNPSTTGNSFNTTSYRSSSSETPVTYSAPGLYGQAPVSFVAGQGVLARPHFSYSGSISSGFDDNVLSTPYNALATKEVTEKVEVSPFIPAQTIFFTIPAGPRSPIVLGPRPIGVLNIPAQKAVFKNVVVAPAVPAPQPIASFFERASANYDVQFSSRKSVFTMSLSGSASYYADRPKDHTDLNGSLNIFYLHRVTPRLQFSANVNVAYLSQPDVAQVNGPTVNLGDYLSETSKFDLTYQWNKRFSTVTSLSYNTNIYVQKTSQDQSFAEYILGNEARYIYNSRLTLVGELRYQMDDHGSDSDFNTHSVIVVAGGDLNLSRKLSATLRLGQELRTFDTGGQTRTSPYGETTLNYRYSRNGVLSWNSRIGYEEPPGPTITTTVLRSNLSVAQSFSARTKGTLAFSVAHGVNSSTAGGTDTLTNTFDISAGLTYMLDRRTNLTANYEFTNTLSNVAGSNYVRNQIFFGISRSY